MAQLKWAVESTDLACEAFVMDNGPDVRFADAYAPVLFKGNGGFVEIGSRVGQIVLVKPIMLFASELSKRVLTILFRQSAFLFKLLDPAGHSRVVLAEDLCYLSSRVMEEEIRIQSMQSDLGSCVLVPHLLEKLDGIGGKLRQTRSRSLRYGLFFHCLRFSLTYVIQVGLLEYERQDINIYIESFGQDLARSS